MRRYRVVVTAALSAITMAVVGCGAIDQSQDAVVYPVVSVADGDTITVTVDGAAERIRLIGIDAPELSNPAECFGRESADYADRLMTGQRVQLIADDSQDDRDRYGRLLRYVVLSDGTSVNESLIRGGYAIEYTYDSPYRYQDRFRSLEAEAQASSSGLWSAATCPREQPAEPTRDGATPECAIKANVNSKGDKIYHLPGDDSYEKTVITPGKGERYFCTTAEAESAGWRAAKK
jgi:micrococcal nuclease